MELAINVLGVELGWLLTSWQQEVPQVVEVDFHHIARKFCLEVVHLSQDIEQLDNGSGSQSWFVRTTLNGECFSRACLTISKDTHVVPIDCTLDQPLCILKHLFLRALRPKDRVEIVVFWPSFKPHGEGELIVNLDAHVLSLLILELCF